LRPKKRGVCGCSDRGIANSAHEQYACLRGTAKLRRAHGGCLGDRRRRRTWTAAISFGEPLAGFDPEISEWGNPSRDYLPAHGESIAMMQRTRGTETSKYPEEEKATAIPLVVASERGSSLNLPSASVLALLGGSRGILQGERHFSQRVIKERASRTTWKRRPKRVTAP
jgi:hypothetical protein